VGNDIYAFIPNVYNNSLTRIRFAGCQDIPGTGVKDPAPITYPRPGLYNINLLVDLGLPTQTSFCKQVRIDTLPQGAFLGDTVCYGNSPALLFQSSQGAAPFSINYDDGSGVYTQGNLDGHSAVPLPYPLTAPGAATFNLRNITDANGCSTATSVSSKVLIEPLPQGGISGAIACSADSAVIRYTSGGGVAPFQVQLTDGTNTYTKTLDGSATIKLPPLSASATISLQTITDSAGCVRSSGFASPTVALHLFPSPVVQFSPLDGVCLDKWVFPVTAAKEVSGAAGAGVYSGAGIDAQGNFQASLAGAGTHMLVYTYTASDGCKAADSTPIVVYPLPPAQQAITIDDCGGIPIRLPVTGSSDYTYEWTPAAGLNDPTLPAPTATIDGTTTFIGHVTDRNGCSVYDTVTVDAHISSTAMLVLPNSFTPNGDGHNDCFGIQRWGRVELREFSVYDRWGVRVFNTKNPAECWDGTYKGQMQPAGGYAYVIQAKTVCGFVTRTGTVMLIR